MDDVRGSAGPATEPLTFDDVVGLMQILDGSDLPTTIDFRNGPLRIKIERGTRAAAAPAPTAPVAVAPVAQSAPAPVEPAPAAPAPVSDDADGVPVRAPIAGVFYRAPRPEADPFVEVGTHVDAEDVIGIVEVMKLMNNLRAGVTGVVIEICAANAELVEFQQVLVRIRPDGDAT